VKEQEIIQLAENQPEMVAMPQAFYRDPDIYQRDIYRIFLNSWLYAGHHSEIPKTGDWFLFELADESVIIVRTAEGEINALLNVCRQFPVGSNRVALAMGYFGSFQTIRTQALGQTFTYRRER